MDSPRSLPAQRTDAPREVEIKLDLDGAAAAMLEATLSARARPERLEQRAVYFDTPDHRLIAAGFTLRIRACGGRLVQTVKTLSPGAGLFGRGEWERPVTALRPVADSRVTGLPLDAERVDALVPVFVIETARTRWRFASPGSATLVTDRALIQASDRQCMFHEAEVELEPGGGGIGAAFALVRQLDAAAPLRIAVLSKAERGYRLLGPVAAAYKAEPVALDRGMTVAQALPVLINACLRHYRLNEAILLDRHEGEAVHQARVALRRLRSALAIFRALLDARARHVDEALARLARELGAVRDLDVALQREDLAPYRPVLKRRQAAAYATLVATLRAPETRAVFLYAVAWLADIAAPGPQSPIDDRPLAAFAREALNRARRRLARRAIHFERLSPAARHRTRMAAKRLHYADDFFAPIFTAANRPRRIARFSRALGKLQDRLGELNDLATAHALIRDLGVIERDGRSDRKPLKRAHRTLRHVLHLPPYWRDGRDGARAGG
ncbi:CHAD domain-containing protein [Sphingomonas sp. H39-1-10]|uniref:CYTH and CHAD domain-containing protein n=1 Tax=Sphingomonas pollutisoli TaxID=3030829 RepID=UPI0023B8AB49|nr:CHAD domain-containing protein [Sphingomonas pollutisoli]MDF0487246.1 CHAD domain-containing protein [Sphingomonas pollutisoli]